jgi:hypothetical protein
MEFIARCGRVGLECFGDVEIWKAVASLAPIGTALIALSAALIALRAIQAQKDIARGRAAIDFFLKTDLDPNTAKLYTDFRKIVPTIRGIDSWTDFMKTDEFKTVRSFLNICELIAVGVRHGAFSERLSFAYWGDVLPASYNETQDLIREIRVTPGEGTRDSLSDLEWLCKRWADEQHTSRINKPLSLD